MPLIISIVTYWCLVKKLEKKEKIFLLRALSIDQKIAKIQNKTSILQS
jgi:hypothetical protein